MDQDPTGAVTPEGRDHRSAMRALAHDIANLASRLTFLSANLQPRLTDEVFRAQTSELLDDTTRRLQEVARKLREMTPDA